MTMANVIYDSFINDVFAQNMNVETGTFYGMLVTDSYTPNKGTHAKRSDVTNEVTGTGYTAGGAATTVTVSLDTTNHRLNVDFSDISWTTSTITARGIVIYHHRGGSSSADELVCAATFGSDISSSGGTFTAHQTGDLRFQMP